MWNTIRLKKKRLSWSNQSLNQYLVAFSAYIPWSWYLQNDDSLTTEIFLFIYRDVGNNYVYPSLNHPEDALSKQTNTSLVQFGKTEVFFHLDTLEKHYLSQRKFLCGPAPTLADSWIAIVLSLLELVCLDLTPWPKVKSWMCSMKSNSDYVDVSYNHEEMVRKSLGCLNSSASDLKTMDIDNVT